MRSALVYILVGLFAYMSTPFVPGIATADLMEIQDMLPGDPDQSEKDSKESDDKVRIDRVTGIIFDYKLSLDDLDAIKSLDHIYLDIATPPPEFS